MTIDGLPTLSRCSGDPGPGVPPMTIGEMFRESVERWPDVVALREVDPDGALARSWTYRELLRESERVGRALASRHAPGARVAVYANNVPEWVFLELGSAMAGLVLVTVNPAFILPELRYVLRQSAAEAVYFVESFRGNPLGEIARMAAEELGIRAVPLSDHQALFAGEHDGMLREPAPNDAAQIQYTSGTTGQPKGALLHHYGLARNALDTLRIGGVRPGTAFALCTPLFHTTGCAVQVLGGLGMGATILLPPAFDPALTARLIDREKLGFALFVPTMMIAVMEAARRDGHDLGSVRRIMAGGSMVAPEIWRNALDAFGARVQIVYGQTECSPVITLCAAEDSPEDMTDSVGRPISAVEVSIRDTNTNQAVPVGVHGEICCRGYLLMLGYHENPKATAATIDSEGWLHTGDLGTMDSRGFVRVTGRVKEMIIRGGENLFPVEIENAMLEHEAIAEAAVVGIPDEKWGELVACFMRGKNSTRPEECDLKAFVRERLSPQKTPQHWIWVDQWPLTASGKIQKFKLRESFVAGEYER
ncbi:MAG TPA: AMP-binding protein [Allosphingosinicella sp.]